MEKEKSSSTPKKSEWSLFSVGWESLVLGYFLLVSVFEFLSGTGTIVGFSIFIAVCYYLYLYSRSKNKALDGSQLSRTKVLGISLIIIFAFFSLSNFLMMASGELESDMSLMAILPIVALVSSTYKVSKLVGENNA